MFEARSVNGELEEKQKKGIFDEIIKKIESTSFGSLKTVNGPSNSGFGENSKLSTSAEMISRLQIRYP